MNLEVYCVEQLHRLPCEVEAPMYLLMRNMVAMGVASEKREAEMRRQTG